MIGYDVRDAQHYVTRDDCLSFALVLPGIQIRERPALHKRMPAGDPADGVVDADMPIGEMDENITRYEWPFRTISPANICRCVRFPENYWTRCLTDRQSQYKPASFYALNPARSVDYIQ